MTIAKINNISKDSIFKTNGINFNQIDSYTKLLINFDGTDGKTTHTAQTGQTVTFAGTAQLDTAQKKFGTASLLLDGDSDYVTVPDSDDWTFGSSDFTIDCWARFANITNKFNVLLAQQVDTSNYWRFFKYNDNAIRFTVVSGGVAVANYRTDASIISAINTWYHLAVVRSGTNIYLFVDGIQNTTELTAVGSNSLPNFAEVLSIGRSGGGGLYHEGYIDHPRISKGVARWTTNFTPPTRSYSNDVAKINNISI